MEETFAEVRMMFARRFYGVRRFVAWACRRRQPARTTRPKPLRPSNATTGDSGCVADVTIVVSRHRSGRHHANRAAPRRLRETPVTRTFPIVPQVVGKYGRVTIEFIAQLPFAHRPFEWASRSAFRRNMASR